MHHTPTVYGKWKLATDCMHILSIVCLKAHAHAVGTV